jgi:hypothetical protein
MGVIYVVPCIMIEITKMTNKMQLCRIIYCSLAALHVSSDIFAHHQEHLNCRLSLDISRQRHTWIIPEAVNTVKMLLMMSENITRNMYSRQGTINYPTQLHLVGYFRRLLRAVAVITCRRLQKPRYATVNNKWMDTSNGAFLEWYWRRTDFFAGNLSQCYSV